MKMVKYFNLFKIFTNILHYFFLLISSVNRKGGAQDHKNFI